jgi:hypothetical protein
MVDVELLNSSVLEEGAGLFVTRTRLPYNVGQWLID